jgi:hypothetical protein
MLIELLGEMQADLPLRRSLIGSRGVLIRDVPNGTELHLPRSGPQDPGPDKPLYPGVHAPRERVRGTKRPFLEPILLEPLDAEPGIGRHVPVELRQLLIEHLIDQGEGGANAHGRPVGFVDPRIPREDRHPRPDRRLPKIDWRDLPLLQLAKGFRKLGPQRVNESSPIGKPGISGPRAARKNDGRR